MKSIKKIIAFVLSIGIILGLTGCELIGKTPEGEKKTVVAKVNNEKLTKGEFDKRLQGQILMYESVYGKGYFSKKENESAVKMIKENLLNSSVEEMLLLQKAEELKIYPDTAALDKEVNAKFEEDKKGKTEEEFKKELDEFKITADEYKANIKKQIVLEKLYEEMTKGASVSDSDITTYYNQNLYDYTEKPNVMNVSHILVASEDEAKKVIEEYKAGAKFEDLAKKYGTDATKDKGGLLGDIEYNTQEYDRTFVAAAITVQTGQISPPVQTQFGYHVIKINSKQEYPAKPLDTVKEDIKSRLMEEKKSEKYTQTLQEWKDKASIKTYPDRV